MKSAILTPQGFEIRTPAIPACGAGQILVQALACGICEGDVFQYRFHRATSRDRAGHEGGSAIAAVARRRAGPGRGPRCATLCGRPTAISTTASGLDRLPCCPRASPPHDKKNALPQPGPATSPVCSTHHHRAPPIARPFIHLG
jgi:hypothetical protein